MTKITFMDYVTGTWYPKLMYAFKNATPEQKKKMLKVMWGGKMNMSMEEFKQKERLIRAIQQMSETQIGILTALNNITDRLDTMNALMEEKINNEWIRYKE